MSYVPPSMRNRLVKTADQKLNEQMELVAEKPDNVFPHLCATFYKKSDHSFIEKAEQWKKQKDELDVSLKVEEEMNRRRHRRMEAEKAEMDFDNKFNILPKKRPQIIMAKQIEPEVKGDWIDPYAAKRRKNAKYNQRKEIKRIQRLEREELSSDEEQVVEIVEESETMWKE
jgi:hypothetical protein